MRLKRVSCTIGLLLLLPAFSAASASQLTDVGLQSKDHATTLTIRANGAFTHTEYRPTQNLLLVDLAGVSAAKLENKSRDLHGQFPGVESYHVLGYKGTSGAETTRVELTLASDAVVNVVDAKNSVSVRIQTNAASVADVAARADAPKVAATAFAPATTEKASPVARKPVRVQNVSVSRGKSGMNIEISASGAMMPKAMKLTAPDRIVVDIPNSIPTTVKHQIAVNSGDVKAVRISHYQMNPPTTRIVVDMAAAKEFELSNSGSHAILRLRTAVAQASTPATQAVALAAKAVEVPVSAAPAAPLQATNA